MFDFKNIDDFDNHIKLSIPNYEGLTEIFKTLVLEYMPERGICIDLGCSSGSFLNSIKKTVGGKYIGVDIVNMHTKKDFEYINADFVTYLDNIDRADVIICMFSLQFLGNNDRKSVIKNISRLVKDGSIALIAEKVFLPTPRVNHAIHRAHIKQKRHGFSDKEILDKDDDLLGSMFCKEQDEIEAEFKFIGKSNKVWQSHNFMGYCIV